MLDTSVGKQVIERFEMYKEIRWSFLMPRNLRDVQVFLFFLEKGENRAEGRQTRGWRDRTVEVRMMV